MDQSFLCHVRAGRTLEGDGKRAMIIYLYQQIRRRSEPKYFEIKSGFLPRELQQRFNARVVDDDPPLQHESGVKDDGLHTELRHHI